MLMANMDSLGPDALLQASRECKFRLIRLLIEGGTLANVRNDDQETPLILACKSESEEKEKVVEFLIRKRVKVNLQDIHGRTALMYACLTNSSDNIVRMLVNSKANPWLVDETKNTAFDYAINAGNIGTVKVMIQACKEGKILTKPGSFNMEMKRLEDRLDQMPEIRKCSWPLMGPRNSTGKEKRSSNQSNLLAVSEVDEVTESPTRERRRKRSICHFDPLDLEGNEGTSERDSSPKPLRKSSLASAGRSASEDERISLHFSDSDGSSFDRSSANFSSLEKLLRMRDSITSSVDSNDSTNAQNSPSLGRKSEGPSQQNYSLISGPQINNGISETSTCAETLNTEGEFKKSKEESKKTYHETQFVKQDANTETDLRFPAKRRDADESKLAVEGHSNDGKKGKNLKNPNDIPKETNAEFVEGPKPSTLPSGTGQNNPVSPRVPRRRTVGSLSSSQKGDVTEDWERKKTGNESTARRFTVGAVEMHTDEKRRSPTLLGDEHSYRPSPPPRDLLLTVSCKPVTFVTTHENKPNCINATSPEMKLYRKKIRSPEVDFAQSNSTAEQELMNGKKSEPLKSELKVNAFLPFNLPVISPPENMENKEKGREEKECGNYSQVEKSAVRRTLSDSVSQGRRRASATGTRSNHHGNDREESSCVCVNDPTAGTAPLVTRERSASFTPLSTTAVNTPPLERKSLLPGNVTPCCDIVTMATSTTGDTTRSRSSRSKLPSDLPDLVLHAPRSRVRSPNNLDPFSLAPELQATDPILTRYTRSAPSSPDTYLPGSHTCVSKSSSSYLPEVVSGTTGSPKERRAAFLPPLNICRKQQAQDSEDGYFSCSPSPLDLESPSRAKEKSKYSFKPSSPRLMNRPVKNLLP